MITVARSRQGHADRGAVSVELVILAPVLLVFVLMVIFAGRWAIAQQAVASAAADAARSASLARSAGDAAGSASSAGYASLDNQDLRCQNQEVAVDTSQFNLPPGIPAQVSVTVTCVVDMSDLVIPGTPGSRTLTATMTSPLDTYRSRQG
ncbi:TadE family protein [Ornithinimicrobium murale]|uniref:TadE family protein n=1 Tax=Ornithinimicrobium murale TaxID=1050153 RepID=UPI001EDD5153|nr:TadE family protein [Ornithinimicrobium murale]